jgi:membrane protease YdiL (CAAX protease family)
MSKKTIYLLGLATLLLFPAIGLSTLWFFSNKNPWELLEFSEINVLYSFVGLLGGVFFAFVSLWIFNRPFFDGELSQQKRMISALNLNLFDKVFLSFCAGFGEEILFRVGMQHYLGVWITSVVFIAIHGYLNPKKPKIALYGLFLLPFILTLAFAYPIYGLWPVIFAHFSYDLVLFLFIKKEEEKLPSAYNFADDVYQTDFLESENLEEETENEEER